MSPPLTRTNSAGLEAALLARDCSQVSSIPAVPTALQNQLSRPRGCPPSWARDCSQVSSIPAELTTHQNQLSRPRGCPPSWARDCSQVSSIPAELTTHQNQLSRPRGCPPSWARDCKQIFTSCSSYSTSCPSCSQVIILSSFYSINYCIWIVSFLGSHLRINLFYVIYSDLGSPQHKLL
jgi:hypothetical protein